MPTAHVKYKLKATPTSGWSQYTNPIQVTKSPPTESEVLAVLRKKHQKSSDFVILEIK